MMRLEPFRSHHRGPAVHGNTPAFRSARVVVRAQPSSSSAYCFDIDAVLLGLDRLHARWGANAWHQLQDTADVVPGSPDLYISTLQQLLPAIQHPSYEPALLMRLLAEEGVVGSRSVSGKQGPVVGRPVRHSGSRPLLVQEILEHWESEIKPTCLLRWSRQAALTPEQLEQQLQQAYMQAQSALHWQVLDSQHHCHGSSSSSTSRETPAAAQSPSSSSSNSTGRQAASAAATATIPAAAAAGLAPPGNTSVIVQPYTAVVQAIRSCPHPVVIASTYPMPITLAALAAAGLQVQGKNSVEIIQAASLARCALRLLEQRQGQEGYAISQQQQQQQQQQQGEVEVQQPCSTNVTFVLSSPSKAKLVQQSIAQQHAAQVPAGAARSEVTCWQPQQQLESLQVGEWCCSAPSLRAKALASPQMGLLSECGLAELLDVSDCDAVMDGIAWRQ